MKIQVIDAYLVKTPGGTDRVWWSTVFKAQEHIYALTAKTGLKTNLRLYRKVGHCLLGLGYQKQICEQQEN